MIKMVKQKLNPKIELQIYEMTQKGCKAYVIAKNLNLDIKVVQKSIRACNAARASRKTAVDCTPEIIYNYLDEVALNLSKESAKKKTVIQFKLSYDEFDEYYCTWRSDYMEKGLDPI